MLVSSCLMYSVRRSRKAAWACRLRCFLSSEVAYIYDINSRDDDDGQQGQIRRPTTREHSQVSFRPSVSAASCAPALTGRARGRPLGRRGIRPSWSCLHDPVRFLETSTSRARWTSPSRGRFDRGTWSVFLEPCPAQRSSRRRTGRTRPNGNDGAPPQTPSVACDRGLLDARMDG